jgi:hypothetical protein
MIRHIGATKSKFFLFFIIISILVALRPGSVGSDSDVYAGAFIVASIEEGIGAPRWEIGYRLFMELVGVFTSSPNIFFFFVALLISILHFLSYKASSKETSLHADIIFVSLLLLSRWTITEMTNGIRQGIALSFLYWAIITQLRYSNFIRFFFLFIVSASFHLSVIFVLPFFMLVKVGVKKLSLIWILVLVFYIFGMNERILQTITTYFNLDIVEQIRYYSVADRTQLANARWVGLQWDQLAYTVFFGLIAMLVFFIKRSGADDNEPYPFILKVYLILSLQYFVFGFGPYSNRYAVMAWFFLPILLSAVVSKLNFKKQDLIFIAPILFLVSVCYFVFVRLDWASFV